MNKDQMEMLSVKNAIERTVQSYISAYTKGGSSADFFCEIERFIAGLFVSGQIDNTYFVKSDRSGDLEIQFASNGHSSNVKFLLPKCLQWKGGNAAEVSDVSEESPQDDASNWIIETFMNTRVSEWPFQTMNELVSSHNLRVQEEAPVSPPEGTLWQNPDSNQMCVWNDGEWMDWLGDRQEPQTLLLTDMVHTTEMTTNRPYETSTDEEEVDSNAAYDKAMKSILPMA